MKKSKFWTIVLSFIPGVGHMYLGLMKQGVQLMSLFFGFIFLIAFLHVDEFAIFIPILWFYNLFDAFNKVSSDVPVEDGDVLFFQSVNLKRIQVNHKWIGYVLIGLGIFVFSERVLLNALGRYFNSQWIWTIKDYLQTTVLSFLFIAGGIKLLSGAKVSKISIEEEEV